MSSDLSAGKCLETLETLKSAIGDFGARARKLNDDLRTRLARERRLHEIAMADHEKTTAAALAELETRHNLEAAAARDRYEKRKQRIGIAYQASKESGLKRVEERIGARKYELQKKMLQAERERDSGLEAAATAIGAFRSSLAAEQNALAHLESRAQLSFKGYGALTAGFFKAYEQTDSPSRTDEHALLTELRDLIGKSAGQLGRFRGLVLVRMFRFIWVWIILALCVVGAVPVLRGMGVNALTYPVAVAAAAGFVVVVLGVRFAALRQALPQGREVAAGLARARRTHDACHELSESHYQQLVQQIHAGYQSTQQGVDRDLKGALSGAGDLRVACRMSADERTVKITRLHEQRGQARLRKIEQDYHDAVESLRRNAAEKTRSLTAAWTGKQKELNAQHSTAWRAIEAEWQTAIKPLFAAMNESQNRAEKLFPSWDSNYWNEWKPPGSFSHAARFGVLDADLDLLSEVKPGEAGLALPGPSRLEVPLCLGYPDEGSILFETASSGHDEAIGALNNVILRLLSGSPAGRLNFTIIDPVGLGQNFAGVMHLADYEEQIINSRIWTQSTQIEQKLADLNEHMEKVIQMYLRNEYQTIAEYNEQAGVIAEKYHFLVVADFPANFSDVAAKRLMSIAASGARCGVYMLLHWDQRLPLPQDFIPDELRKSCLCITHRNGEFVLAGRNLSGTRLQIEAPPPPEAATAFVNLVGRLSRDSSRVQVPFEQVAPSDAEIWSEETTAELRVPIGRTGATKLQYMAIGKGTCQHGLIAGKTGSGKSTLFHVIITNLALWCSPEQVEFYLVDFKKGVEFKCYGSRRLPHARVVAIESDREFALSVLQRIDDELRRRGDLFRQLGVQDLPGYKRAGGSDPIPRTLLLVDEFQEYFVEDDKIAQTASLLLDRIVRQGRAFGIHVLLGSQTLGGAYTVARTTLGQMVIRIALQCNEADAYLIMDDTNPAPRLLSRPGEGIYNDMAGALEGNSPFQTVWLPEEVRDAALSKIRARADRSGKEYASPIVFEGNAPADVRENVLLKNLLSANAVDRPAAGRIWLGAPNSIKGPTEAVFQRQSGNNLLIVGQREEATQSMLSIGLIALAAQYPLGKARFIVCDATPAGTPEREYLERVIRSIPHPVTLAKPGDIPSIMGDLDSEKKSRAEAPDPDAAPPVYLILHDLQKFSRLRYEEDFGFSSGDAGAAPNPGAVFNDLICDGARLGFHIIATCDTYNNVSRFLSRKAISEFEMRLLFQMSANDSASLIDNPKAGMLGLHRALFFNAQEGYLETFRPYALPAPEWIDSAAASLARLLKGEPHRP